MPAQQADLVAGYKELANAIVAADNWVKNATGFWKGLKQLAIGATVGHWADAGEFLKEAAHPEAHATDYRARASNLFNRLARMKNDPALKGYVDDVVSGVPPNVHINIAGTSKVTLHLRGLYAKCISDLNGIQVERLDGNGQEAYRDIRDAIEHGIPHVSAAITAEQFFGNLSLPALN